MSYTILIPSANPDNLEKCVHALRAAGEPGNAFAVMDGVRAPTSLDSDPNFSAIYAPPPFSFAKSINCGIRAVQLTLGRVQGPSPLEDIVLLNDDAILLTHHGFHKMWAQLDQAWDIVSWLAARTQPRLLEEPPSARRSRLPWYGILSARVKGPAHPIHATRSIVGETDNISHVGRSVPFVCVMLSGRMVQDLGPLDERFTPGSFEDDDYCLRARMGGWKVGVYNGCTVDHNCLPSTFRPPGEPDRYDFQTNKSRFFEKWGFQAGTK